MSDRHTCHAVGCGRIVPPRLLCCLYHWRMVPRPLQAEVWRTYVPGQEGRKDPTLDYLIAARRAINAVALAEDRITQEQADAVIARLESQRAEVET